MATASVTYPSFAPANLILSSQVNANFADLLTFLNTTGVFVYQAGTVNTAALADGSVTTNKLVDANVTTVKLADSSVTTAKINNQAVTSAKLDPAVLAAIATPPGSGGVDVQTFTANGTWNKPTGAKAVRIVAVGGGGGGGGVGSAGGGTPATNGGDSTFAAAADYRVFAGGGKRGSIGVTPSLPTTYMGGPGGDTVSLFGLGAVAGTAVSTAAGGNPYMSPTGLTGTGGLRSATGVPGGFVGSMAGGNGGSGGGGGGGYIGVAGAGGAGGTNGTTAGAAATGYGGGGGGAGFGATANVSGGGGGGGGSIVFADHRASILSATESVVVGAAGAGGAAGTSGAAGGAGAPGIVIVISYL